MADDGGVSGVVGLSRFLRERAGTAAGCLVVLAGDYKIKKGAEAPQFTQMEHPDNQQ